MYQKGMHIGFGGFFIFKLKLDLKTAKSDVAALTWTEVQSVQNSFLDVVVDLKEEDDFIWHRRLKAD